MAAITILPFSESAALEPLFGRSGCAEGSYAWFRCLAATTLRPDEDAVMAVMRDDAGAPRAALPLVRRGRAIRALTAPYTTLYAPALPDPGWARRLGEGMHGFVPTSLHLDALDPDAPGMAALLAGLEASGLAAARYRHFANWFEPFEDFERYWRARPSRLRTTVRRKLAQAEGAAPDFRCYRDSGELEQAVAIYEDIYGSSWKQAEPHPAFVPGMVRALGQEGHVRLGVMRLSQRPVAAQIWLVGGGRATIFKLAHREDAATASPGTLLTHWMMSVLAREERIGEIDFGRGDDLYKRDWLGRSRMRMGLVAGNPKSLAGLAVIFRHILPARWTARFRR